MRLALKEASMLSNYFSSRFASFLWPPKTKCLAALTQPILALKILNPGEFPFVIGDNRITECNCLCRNEQVIGADWLTSLLKLGAQ